jgi:hypothetical protein
MADGRSSSNSKFEIRKFEIQKGPYDLRFAAIGLRS